MTKYIYVEWPEYQIFMEHPRFEKDCYYCPDASIYFIPEDLYNEVMNGLEFPKKYEDTNLGTIVCYETRAVVNGNETFYYDLSDIRKGDKVLIYNREEDKWIITNCQSAVQGFPILLEEKELLDGINCEIIGHYDPEIPF